MWQRFTERARRIVFFAQEEAARLGENFVGTEHLLLGLVREDDSVACRILNRLDVSLSKIRSEIERQVTRGAGITGQDMQLTPRAKRVVDLAYEEARDLKNNYIGTEHLLLGLIREGDGLAARVLTSLNATLERARQEVRNMQEDTVPAAGETVPPPPRGNLGALRDEGGGSQVAVATSFGAVAEWREVLLSKDHHGFQELRAAEKLRLLPVGTEVKLLRAERENSLYVRITSGDADGELAWVLPIQFEDKGPDTRPFPPVEGAETPQPEPGEHDTDPEKEE